KMLKPFGIVSGSIRIGHETGKGYKVADFTDAFERYLTPPAADRPPPPRDDPTPPCDGGGDGCDGSVTACDGRQTPTKPLGDKCCDGVTAGVGGVVVVEEKAATPPSPVRSSGAALGDRKYTDPYTPPAGAVTPSQPLGDKGLRGVASRHKCRHTDRHEPSQRGNGLAGDARPSREPGEDDGDEPE